MKTGKASWAFLRTSALRSSRHAYSGPRHSVRSEGTVRSVARRSVNQPTNWMEEMSGIFFSACAIHNDGSKTNQLQCRTIL